MGARELAVRPAVARCRAVAANHDALYCRDLEAVCGRRTCLTVNSDPRRYEDLTSTACGRKD